MTMCDGGIAWIELLFSFILSIGHFFPVRLSGTGAFATMGTMM